MSVKRGRGAELCPERGGNSARVVAGAGAGDELGAGDFGTANSYKVNSSVFIHLKSR